MHPPATIHVILGTGTIGSASDPITGFHDPVSAQEFLNIFRAAGGTALDSARIHSPNAPFHSEPILGATDIKSWADVSSKVVSMPGDHTLEGIRNSTNDALNALKLDRLDVLYLHSPDPLTPLEETLAAMDEQFRAGRFRVFGLSNYSIEQVREILRICDARGYVRPGVYQGQYNAVARDAERELLPLLRENRIKFYAWSPAAGGVFSAQSTRLQGNDMISHLFQNAYAKPAVLTALEKIRHLAESAGITGHAVALRWVMHHSALRAEYGDGMVVGARTLGQLRDTMEICAAGPLPREVVEGVDGLWEGIRDVAPSFVPSLEGLEMPALPAKQEG